METKSKIRNLLSIFHRIDASEDEINESASQDEKTIHKDNHRHHDQENDKRSKINTKNHYDQINSLYNVVYSRYKGNQHSDKKRTKKPKIMRYSFNAPDKSSLPTQIISKTNATTVNYSPGNISSKKQSGAIEDFSLNPSILLRKSLIEENHLEMPFINTPKEQVQKNQDKKTEEYLVKVDPNKIRQIINNFNYSKVSSKEKKRPESKNNNKIESTFHFYNQQCAKNVRLTKNNHKKNISLGGLTHFSNFSGHFLDEETSQYLNKEEPVKLQGKSHKDENREDVLGGGVYQSEQHGKIILHQRKVFKKNSSDNVTGKACAFPKIPGKEYLNKKVVIY